MKLVAGLLALCSAALLWVWSAAEAPMDADELADRFRKWDGML